MFTKQSAGKPVNIDWNAKLKALQNLGKQQAHQAAKINNIGQMQNDFFNKAMQQMQNRQPLQPVTAAPATKPGFFGNILNWFKGGELQARFIDDVNDRATYKLACLVERL